MYKLYFVISVLLCYELAAGSVVKRDIPANPSPLTLNEIAERIQAGLREANEEFLKFFGFENNDQVLEKIRTESRNLATAIRTQYDALEKQINSDRNREVIEALKKQVTELTNNLNISNDAKALNEQFQASIQRVTKETQEIVQKLQAEGREIGEDTQKLLKTIYDSTLEAARNVGEAAKNH